MPHPMKELAEVEHHVATLYASLELSISSCAVAMRLRSTSRRRTVAGAASGWAATSRHAGKRAARRRRERKRLAVRGWKHHCRDHPLACMQRDSNSALFPSAATPSIPAEVVSFDASNWHSIFSRFSSTLSAPGRTRPSRNWRHMPPLPKHLSSAAGPPLAPDARGDCRFSKATLDPLLFICIRRW